MIILKKIFIILGLATWQERSRKIHNKTGKIQSTQKNR